ncbi:aspartate aminotransferase family protein [Ensifer sp. ENS07]|uniref:aspartate aminotransferase family protein n=1 Tax=Ensifer sp. ENS07 TaxID=2769274 RepID=UPI001AEE69CC|nr:aspartate aminotransferase family protein [Ensifer sp. ENS07]
MNILPNSKSRALLETARRCMPGGTFNSAYLPEDVDVVISHGKGSRVYDVDGREYIDCLNGSGPMILGHAHPEVVEALSQAVSSPSNYYVLNHRGIELADLLVEAIPCAEQIKFGLSGSDATFFALRLARAFTRRDKVLKFEGGFLGVNDYALMSGVNPPLDAPYPRPVPDSAGIPQAILDDVLIAPFNDLERTLGLIESNKSELAAIIIEAQQRCIEPKPGFLEAIREAATKHGIVLVFDEVVTGFRLGWGGAQERYGVVPDIAAYGKIIGGGLPLSVVAGRQDIMRLTNPRNPGPSYSYISSTMSGNTVASATGLATLRVLKREGVYDRLAAIGQRFKAGAQKAFARHGVPAQIVGNGPLAMITLTDKPVFDHRSFCAGDTRLFKKILHEMLGRGALTHGKFYFSLVHSDDDIDQVVQILDHSIEAALNT